MPGPSRIPRLSSMLVLRLPPDKSIKPSPMHRAVQMPRIDVRRVRGYASRCGLTTPESAVLSINETLWTKRLSGLGRILPEGFAVGQPQSQYFLKHLAIAQAKVRGGVREIFVTSDLGIGIRFQQVKLAVVREPVIQSGITTQAQMTVDALRQQFEPVLEFFRQFSGFCHEPDLLLIVGIPFQPAGGDVQRAFGQIVDHELPRRVGLESSVADHADVDLATFDVLLRYGIAIGCAMDELDSFLEFLVIVNDRRLGYAYRTLFNDRLYKQGKSKPRGARDLLALWKDTETRYGDAVVRQNLLGERLIMRKRQPSRIAARVRLSQEFEVADDVLIEERMPVELFEQVKRDVRLVLFAGLSNHR